MKTELTKLTGLEISEMNSENSIDSGLNSAPLRLCGKSNLK
jgi:hypothetical protein